MKKVICAAALVAIAASAHAEYRVGRKITHVICSDRTVNGIEVVISSVQGVSGPKAQLLHGGFAGYMPTEPEMEVRNLYRGSLQNYSDIATNGKALNLTIDIRANGPEHTSVGTLKVDSKSGKFEKRVYCQFPVHTM